MKKCIYQFFLFFVILLFIFAFFLNNHQLKDDYYEEVNHTILSKNHLEDDTYNWSRFTDAQDKADEKVKEIVQNIISGNTYHLGNRVSSNIKILYSEVLDYEQRNRNDLGPLKYYIDSLMNCNTIEDFKKIGIKIEEDLSVNIFSNMVIECDYLDNHKNIVYFYPMTFAFGSSVDVFVNDDYMSYKAYIKRAIQQLLKIYGYNKKEASYITNELISFYEEVGNHSRDGKSLEDIGNYYHPFSFDDLQDIYFQFDFDSYLKNRLGSVYSMYSVVDSEQIFFLNEYMFDSHLQLLKYYGLIQILSSYAVYLGNDYESVVINLDKGIIGKIDDNKDSKVIDIVSHFFSDEIDSIFSSEVLKDSDINNLTQLFLEIKSSFRDRLRNNSWLSASTKYKALEKLDKMNFVIGIHHENGMGNQISLSGKGLIYDIITFQQVMWKNEIDRLNNFEYSKIMSDTVVNAFYRPQTNSIYVPSAFVYLFNYDNYYSRLGSIGMILAHEMTHGFDANGSKFDSVGNYVNWWTRHDREAFLALQKEVSYYYDQFKIDGRNVDGDATVNENIADLGALNVIVDVATKKKANNKNFRDLFCSFADLWVSQEDEQYMRLLLLTDTHSPNKYRVNAVLSSTDKFYEVYHISFWNDMYISSRDRVRVW